MWQISIDVLDDRLTSLLTQVSAANVERARYLRRRGREILQREEERKTEAVKMEIELEMKTFEREIEQLNKNAEEARPRSLCITM